jgi:catechol 2,3-dioxygenase-like lactoylglutathione lyase family enzyme
MMDHVGIQCADLARSRAFYNAVLKPLNFEVLLDHEVALGYGLDFPFFWLSGAADTQPSREVHLAFRAPSQDAVRQFYTAAMSSGAESLHEPRLWPEYHPGYFGAFVRDPDGNNVEAVHHQFEQ